MDKTSYVYILTNRRNGTLYTGVTSDLIKRIWEHKNEITKGFTQKYDTKKLVYFEEHSDINNAIEREKIIKKWERKWKLGLIEKQNPQWKDLYENIAKY